MMLVNNLFSNFSLIMERINRMHNLSTDTMLCVVGPCFDKTRAGEKEQGREALSILPEIELLIWIAKLNKLVQCPGTVGFYILY